MAKVRVDAMDSGDGRGMGRFVEAELLLHPEEGCDEFSRRSVDWRDSAREADRRLPALLVRRRF